MPACTKIKSIIVNEIIDYHVNHLFPVLCEQVDVAIENASATGLLGNGKAAQQEPNADPIWDMEIKPANCQATRQTLESELFVRNICQRLVMDKTVFKLLATLAYVMSTERWSTGELQQILQKVRRTFRPCRRCRKASKMEHRVHEKKSSLRHLRFQSPSCNACRHGSHRLHSNVKPDNDSPHSWNRASCKSPREEMPLCYSKNRIHWKDVHRTPRWSSMKSANPRGIGKDYLPKVLMLVSTRLDNLVEFQ